MELVPVSDRLLLKDWEAAEVLSVSVSTLLKLPIPRITIPGTRLVRWKRADVEDYVKELGVKLSA